MSRWLKSVNTLLEQLDGQVETAVEEHELARAEEAAVGEGGASSSKREDELLESILAKRGYTTTTTRTQQNVEEQEQGEEEEEQHGEVIANETDPVLKEEKTSSTVAALEETILVAEETENREGSAIVSNADAGGDSENLDEMPSLEESSTGRDVVGAAASAVAGADIMKSAVVTKETRSATSDVTRNVEPKEEVLKEFLLDAEEEKAIGEEEIKPQDVVEDSQSVVVSTQSGIPRETIEQRRPPEKDVNVHPASAPAVEEKAHGSAAPPPLAPQAVVSEHEYKRAISEARDVQKECRTLRRHVVSLNTELEAAEAEIQAQRTELERAAERMEKDRTRQKEERDRLIARHADEMKALKVQHEQTVADLKKRSDQQVEDARRRMKEIEERRMQEGGDWSKEMEQALQREQESVRRLANLEDEKSTLLSQISSLQAQQTALENRLDSVSQTADNAMEREREAEDRLDAALSMHARQLTQRQTRESELERTIADLGAALVVARNKEINRLKSETSDRSAGDRGGNDVSALRSRLEDTEDHLETLKAQLDLERQRSSTLQQELQDMSKERTEEASAAHARQLQSDRKLADMSVTLSRLQASVRDTKKASSFNESGDSTYASVDDGRSSQIRSLSEQVLKQQETITRNKSEILAFKNRLQVAVSRAEKAEEALSSAQDSDDIYDRMERAPLSGTSDGGRQMRRRGRRGNSRDAVSIRSAIHMNPGQGHQREKIGKAIDAVDSFSVQTGRYLRTNPLARAGFLLYLLMIHVWTFVIIIFHAHGFETVHGDFGSGHQMSHGPHALMQAHDAPVTNP